MIFLSVNFLLTTTTLEITTTKNRITYTIGNSGTDGLGLSEGLVVLIGTSDDVGVEALEVGLFELIGVLDVSELGVGVDPVEVGLGAGEVTESMAIVPLREEQGIKG